MAQFFKGDETELKFYNSAKPVIDILSAQKDLMSAGLFEAAPLGDVLYDSKISPLANAIDRDIFREAFKKIFESFTVAGSFEGYITVFKKIFGDDVDLTFTVSAPGKLQIDILATGIELSDFVARYISDNTYMFDEVIADEQDPDDPEVHFDTIAFQSIKGFQSQYELEQMLFEMVPGGVFTEINLSLGA